MPAAYHKCTPGGHGQQVVMAPQYRPSRSSCHDGSTVVRSPPLQGLYGKTVPLESRQLVIADGRNFGIRFSYGKDIAAVIRTPCIVSSRLSEDNCLR